MIEEFEDDLSEWYYKHQEKNLYHWLCWKRVLKGRQKNKGMVVYSTLSWANHSSI